MAKCPVCNEVEIDIDDIGYPDLYSDDSIPMCAECSEDITIVHSAQWDNDWYDIPDTDIEKHKKALEILYGG